MAGLGGASDIGPEPPWKVIYDLASFHAVQRHVRRVVEALRVLMNSCCRCRDDVHRGEEEEHCSRAHGALTGGSYASLACLHLCWVEFVYI